MNIKVALLICACLVALSDAAFFSFAPTNIQAPVGVWSDWVFVQTSQEPTQPLTLDLASNSGVIQFSTTTLSFDTFTQTASFRVQVSSTGPAYPIQFTLTDPSGDFTQPTDRPVQSNFRTVTIDTLPTGNGANYVNKPSEPLKITLQYPSVGDLTFTPSFNFLFPPANPTNQYFEPQSVVIPAGSTSGSYVSYMDTSYNGYVQNLWSISGQEADWYGNVTSTTLCSVVQRNVYTPYYSSNVLPGVESGVLYAYITDEVNTSFSLAVQAADTTFTPNVLVFSPGVQVVNFTFNTTTPESTSTAAGAPKVVTYTIIDPVGGSNEYFTPGSDAINVPRQTITVSAPSIYIQNKVTHLSLRIPAPVLSDLTVWLFAANVVFNPTNFTFSGITTSVDIAVFPVAQGPDVFSFTITGTDVDYYNTPASVTGVTVTTGNFLGPDVWYIPTLTVGVQSDRFPVAVNVAPDTEVILTPTSPDLTFTPAQATFTSSTTEQFFTITPSVANTAPSNAVEVTTTITFIVTGDQASLFTAPDSLQVTISRRDIQFVWSPHIYLDNSGIATLYLQKHYIVWATANYADQPVTVTPVSPFLTFDPPVLQFSSGNLRIKVTVTVTGVDGSGYVDYIISGVNGGLYSNIPRTQINTQLRPLVISEAVVSPDSRVPGIAISNPSAADLYSNHVYAFQILSLALPEGSLTITPHSNHITFGPLNAAASSSNGYVTTLNQIKSINDGIQFTVPNLAAQWNFTLTPLASGVFEVWFELSGADAAYYAPPPHTFFSFYIEERPAGEIHTPSAASSVYTSFSALLVIMMLVLVL